MHVRELQSDDDIWAVRDLAIAHHNELGEGRAFESSAVVRSAIECREQPIRYMNCWVAYAEDGKAVGYLAASTCRQYHTHRLRAMQDMWYVLPTHRGARAAIMLVDAFEQWAQYMNCESMYMMVEHNVADDKTAKIGKLMTRLGMPQCGSVHFKKLED